MRVRITPGRRVHPEKRRVYHNCRFHNDSPGTVRVDPSTTVQWPARLAITAVMCGALLLFGCSPSEPQHSGTIPTRTTIPSTAPDSILPTPNRSAPVPGAPAGDPPTRPSTPAILPQGAGQAPRPEGAPPGTGQPPSPGPVASPGGSDPPLPPTMPVPPASPTSGAPAPGNPRLPFPGEPPLPPTPTTQPPTTTHPPKKRTR